MFKVNFNKFSALAFLRVSEVNSAYSRLIRTPHFTENEAIWKPFLDYFEATWVGPLVQVRRGASTNKIVWNQYAHLKNEGMRTTSALESWHKKMKTAIGKKSPSFEHFFECIQLEQDSTEDALREIGQGIDTTHQKRHKLEKFKSVTKIALEVHDSTSLLDHLEKIALALITSNF